MGPMLELGDCLYEEDLLLLMLASGSEAKIKHLELEKLC